MTTEHREECQLCGKRFAYSNGAYHGQYFGAWKLLVCNHCCPNAWSRVPSIYRGQVVEHLRSLGITPRTDANGDLFWPS